MRPYIMVSFDFLMAPGDQRTVTSYIALEDLLTGESPTMAVLPAGATITRQSTPRLVTLPRKLR